MPASSSLIIASTLNTRTENESLNKHQLIPRKPFKGLGPLPTCSGYSNCYCSQPGNMAVGAFTCFLLEMIHFITTESFTEGLQLHLGC